MKNLQAIILAAGKSTRFKTDTSKLLHTICGKEMILYPTKLLEKLGIPTTLVVGHQKKSIIEKVTQHHPKNIAWIDQKEQKGTGHAIICTRKTWHQDNILIMNGDMPLITEEVIAKLYEKHMTSSAAISFVVAHNADPTGRSYGRIVKNGGMIQIVEAKHFEGDPHEHCFINAGIYIVQRAFLEQTIDAIEKNSATGEFYFTDLIKEASNAQKTISTTCEPFDCIRGVNDLQELWAAEQIQRSELIRYWMTQGVRFSMPQNVHLDSSVTLERGTVIGAGVHLLGNTTIGKNCSIGPFSCIENSTIHTNVTIDTHAVLRNATVHEHVHIGPFSHIREHSTIKKNCSIGNFVEVKKSTIGEKTDAKHLTYLGDATVGSNVNIGAGTITCNYDGTNKHATTIHDSAFIGSNTALVAPVTIGANATIAAGSVITDTVPENALGIARSRQTNKTNYTKKKTAKTGKKKQTDKNQKLTDPTFVCAIKTNTTSQQP